MQVNTVIEGDCLDVMRGMPDNCIDTILTDPPYSLNFMNKDWDNEIAFNPEVWREALRVAKPGATLMAFGGTRTYHRLACAIEDAGWEIRDCISYFHDGNQAEQALMASLDDEQLAAYLELHYPNHQMAWVYGSGIGLGHDVSKAIDKREGAVGEVVGRDDIFLARKPNNTGVGRMVTNGNGSTKDGRKTPYKKSEISGYITAPATPLAAKWDGWKSRLKPAFEPLICAQKPLDGTFAENAEKWEVAGLWIDGGRIETNGESITTHSRGRATAYPKRSGEKYVEESGRMTPQNRPEFVGHERTARYPANVILDGSEAVEAEFAKAGVRTSGNLTGQPRGENKIYGSAATTLGTPRYYTGDTGSASRYFAHCPSDTEPARLYYCPKAGPKERATPGNNHPTQKPLSLMRYLARLTRTPDGGLVLDPFAGSGTTALAAISEGRDYILIEKEPEYAEICRRRIAEYTGQEVQAKEIKVATETVKQLGLW